MLDGRRPVVSVVGAYAPLGSRWSLRRRAPLRSNRFAALVLLAGPAALGCRESEPRPEALTCADPACSSYVIAPRPVSSEPAGAAGAAGQGGAGGGGGMPTATTRLAGTVLELTGGDLGVVQPLFGQVRVRAESVDGGEPAETAPRSDGGYELDGAPLARGLWVAVGAFESPPSAVYLDTLQPVDSTGAGPTDLYVVPREAMEALAASAYLVSPQELEPARAHVLVRFVDRDGAPTAGVRITFPAPSEVPAAYDGGGVYSDGLEETSDQGAAVLLNLAAPAWPGASGTIQAEYAGSRFLFQVQLAADSVSLVTAVVPEP